MTLQKSYMKNSDLETTDNLVKTVWTINVTTRIFRRNNLHSKKRTLLQWITSSLLLYSVDVYHRPFTDCFLVYFIVLPPLYGSSLSWYVKRRTVAARVDGKCEALLGIIWTIHNLGNSFRDRCHSTDIVYRWGHTTLKRIASTRAFKSDDLVSIPSVPEDWKFALCFFLNCGWCAQQKRLL